LSLTALLLYLSRINSYVDRHKRITVPAIVTAATMQRSAYELNLTLHLFLEQITKADAADTLARLSRHAEQIRSSLDLYRSTHAARTHPILLGMLTQHQRMDLADQEDRAIARIDLILQELSALWADCAHRTSARRRGTLTGREDRRPHRGTDEQSRPTGRRPS
jgi:hypothetical protein